MIEAEARRALATVNMMEKYAAGEAFHVPISFLLEVFKITTMATPSHSLPSRSWSIRNGYRNLFDVYGTNTTQEKALP